MIIDVGDVDCALSIDGNRWVVPRICAGVENGFSPCSTPAVHHGQAVGATGGTRIVVCIDNDHLALITRINAEQVRSTCCQEIIGEGRGRVAYA